MKTRQFTHAALLLGCTLAVLTACSANEDELKPKEKTPVGINASITGEAVTRADATYTPTNASAEKIYLYYKDGSNTIAKEKAVFVYSSGSWGVDAGNKMFWDDLSPVSSKYPFFAVAPVDLANATSGAVEQDQSTKANQIKSDLLMAYTEVATQKTAVDLIFKHMLAKLTVKVKVGDVNGFSSSVATIKNAIKDYTVSYVGPTTAAPATVAVASAGQSITPVAITPFAEADDSYDTGKTMKVYSAVLPAQTIGNGGSDVNIEIKITLASGASEVTNTYTFKPSSAITLAQGKHTILTLTITGTTVTLGTVQVTDWTEEPQSGDITID